MNRLTNRLVLAGSILVAVCLMAGCGSAINHVKAAVSSVASAHGVTGSPADSPTPPASPTTPASPTAPVSPTTPPPTTVTAPPTTSTVTAPASPSPSSATSKKSSKSGTSATSLLWLWIALGALVVIGLTVLIARRSGRRSAMAGSWRSKAADARARGSALYDAMSMAEVRGPSDPREDSARWPDIQHRADDLDQLLYELRESAPGQIERADVEDVLASLHAVRSAMGAERTPGGNTAQQGARVQDLLRSFGASLRALRPPNDYGP
jgi:hypothetical protein